MTTIEAHEPQKVEAHSFERLGPSGSPHPDDPTVRRTDTGWVRAEITIDDRSDHTLWWGLSEDFVAGGVFLATHLPLRLGTSVEIALRLPELGPPLVVTGTIRWSRTYAQGSEAPPGVGIQFLPLPSDALDPLLRFARTIREPLLHELDERSSRPPAALAR